MENYPLGIKVRIEPKQEGSGDPSPENVRPIVGINMLSMTQCGKNLLNPANMEKTVTQNGFTAERLADGRYHIYGTSDNNDAYINLLHGSNFPAFQANTPYTITLLGSNQLSPSIFLRIDGAWVNKPVSQTANSKTYVFDRVDFDTVLIRASVKGSGIEIDDIISVQITIGTEVQTSYEPYCGDTYNIALPETVYGGTLDLGTGNAEITWAIKTLEVAKFSYNTTINCLLGFNNPLPGIEKPANNTMVAGIKCNKAVSRSASAINGGNSGIGVDINGNIYFRSDGLTSLDDYISAFGDNITVAYKIAEPHTIQIDIRQITALPGVNTIYTDADGVIVTGAEDPKHAITKKVNGIAPDETGNVTLTAADVGALPVSGGDMTGPINMNGQSISGLNSPTEDTQAANKGYMDEKIN